MTSPAKFKKDKEIIAEYDTQVKGRDCFVPLCLLVAALPRDCGSLQWMLGGEGEMLCRLPGICRARS